MTAVIATVVGMCYSLFNRHLLPFIVFMGLFFMALGDGWK